ncbi:MAG: TonB-dependent receptor domain-containing protein, partial [Gammaproteobacteria bacterium]
MGLTGNSQKAARRALALDPGLERTQTVTGFSYLLRMEADEAMEAFQKAVYMDSTSPLARLGLGLAKIRKGDLEEGRHDLEIAAILDPNNSINRSYLGKAYYEEKRSDLSEDQFKLAKERDPKDPTPYFYDALKKQSENRPVEALHDLQSAMALNENRAVYRSKQLLDADRAARGASLARIYDTLGFDQRGTLEASQSIALDPTNYSAHRFLSDSYVRFPARGAAQTSELLIAQLLQPININPIQPHLSVSNRSQPIGLGISEPLFRDFTRVFERNRPQLTVSGLYGNLDTGGDEAVLSGIHDNLSYSFGQYHFATDGFRDNADIRHDIYNAFLQAAITDELNVQFEYLHRKTEQGDLIQTLDPEKTFFTDRSDLTQNKFRGGLHFKPHSSIDLIATAANLPSDVNIFSIDRGTRTHRIEGWAGDVQLILNSDAVDFIIGGNTYDKSESVTLKGQSANQQTEGNSFYTYSYIQLPYNILGTLGVNRTYFETTTSFEDTPNESYSRWQPKIGIQWDPMPYLKFRFAYAESLKASLFADQTIEPTQIAGFNQLYDDFNGQHSTLYAAAVDFNWPELFFAGFQFNRRDLDIVDDSKFKPQRQADAYTGYFNWMLTSNMTLNAEYTVERDNIYTGLITDLKTYKIPVNLRYFDPNGIFAQLGMTYVAQNQWNIDAFNGGTVSTSESFVLADAAIGYRLPKRLGVISLEVRNLLDKHFNYNDKWRIEQADIFQMSRQQEFLPARTVLARILLNF